jgi:hypothetical protein
LPLLLLKEKSEVVYMRAMKVYEEVKAQLHSFFNVGTRWKGVCQLHAISILALGYTEYKAGWRFRSGGKGEEKISLALDRQ